MMLNNCRDAARKSRAAQRFVVPRPVTTRSMSVRNKLSKLPLATNR